MAETSIRIGITATDKASAALDRVADKLDTLKSAAAGSGNSLDSGFKSINTLVGQIDSKVGSILSQIRATGGALRGIGVGTLGSFGGGLAIAAVQYAYQRYREAQEAAAKVEKEAAEARIRHGRDILESLEKQATAYERQLAAQKAIAAAEGKVSSALSSIRRAEIEGHYLAMEAANGPLSDALLRQRDYELGSAGIQDTIDALVRRRGEVDADSASANAALASIEERRAEALRQLEEERDWWDESGKIHAGSEKRRAELHQALQALSEEEKNQKRRLELNAIHLDAIAQEGRALMLEKANFEQKAANANAAAAAAERARAVESAQAEWQRALAAGRASVAASLSATLSQRRAGAAAMGQADVFRLRALMDNGTLRNVRGGYFVATQDAAERRARKTESWQDEMKRLLRDISERHNVSTDEILTLAG